MTTYIGWTPPPGVAVVAPPVHPKTTVIVMFSDDSRKRTKAKYLNWSSVGDGPCIVAYAVVSEYKPAPEPREWFDIATAPRDGTWFYAKALTFDDPAVRVVHFADSHDRFPIHDDMPPWTVAPTQWRPLPAAREVVAWAVFRDGQRMLLTGNDNAAWQYADKHGGTVVKLTGVMP